ncbi:MAG: hypothetical protein AAGA48_25130 [Myxococcota bacterium]
MGFLFDSIRHLLASDPAEKQDALARMLGRVLSVEPVALPSSRVAASPPAGTQDGVEAADPPPAVSVVHYPKVSGRPFAITLTIGASSAVAQEYGAVSLADAQPGADHRFAELVAVAWEARAAVGDVVALPEGLLGRSSHTHAVVLDQGSVLREEAEYVRILGAPIAWVVPVTSREAEWIASHSAAAFDRAMREQGVEPYVDRPAGTTQL